MPRDTRRSSVTIKGTALVGDMGESPVSTFLTSCGVNLTSVRTSVFAFGKWEYKYASHRFVLKSRSDDIFKCLPQCHLSMISKLRCNITLKAIKQLCFREKKRLTEGHVMHQWQRGDLSQGLILSPVLLPLQQETIPLPMGGESMQGDVQKTSNSPKLMDCATLDLNQDICLWCICNYLKPKTKHFSI